MPWNEKVLGCTQPSEPFFEFRDADNKPSYSLRLPKLSHSCLASSHNCSHGLNCSSRAKTSLSPGTTSDPAVVRHTEIINSVVYVASNPSRKSKGNKDNERQAQAFPMVPGNSVKVIEHQPTGKLSEHRAVSILEQDQEINIREGSQNGNNRGFMVKVAKENIKMGLEIRKQSNSKTISRPVLSEWVDTVNNQLDSIAFQKEIDPRGVSKVVVSNGGSLELVQASDRHQLPGGLAMDPVEVSDDVNEPMVS
ncbi:hypothetical protein V6N11_081024 [Hibiscus sabdariffa]|uniref:Uncharacterized protein n=1 Tax=Hibiscus sabdariffa TaxID=183260 RepID=A0ABR2QJ75_9ROSI